jgi:hypothetical protein
MKNKETLEEAALLAYPIHLIWDEEERYDCNEELRETFIEGAKWQQNKIDIFNARMEKERAENKAFLELHRQERLYSEEEVIQLVSDWTDYRMSEDTKSKVTFKKWFEEFKNK